MKILLPVYFLLKSLFAGCHAEMKHTGFKRDRTHKIIRVSNIDAVVKECSGLAFNNARFYTLGDSGTLPELYVLNKEGELINTITHSDLKNIDWEELCIDKKQGRFFIGDIGNNANQRKDLTVYVLDSIKTLSTLQFSYALQKEFPPAKPLKNYDCEAMVYHHDSLFLFSKNRGEPLVKWYGMSTLKAQQELMPLREIYLKGMVTAAAYDEKSEQLVLLAYGKLYWFKVKNGDVINAEPWLIKKIPFYGQIEAICFDDDGGVYFTNEKGRLYKILAK
jgi:uncharacterized protein YjiK